jgi:hypothetical protein
MNKVVTILVLCLTLLGVTKSVWSAIGYHCFNKAWETSFCINYKPKARKSNCCKGICQVKKSQNEDAGSTKKGTSSSKAAEEELLVSFCSCLDIRMTLPDFQEAMDRIRQHGSAADLHASRLEAPDAPPPRA